jgi:hypothetical protein
MNSTTIKIPSALFENLEKYKPYPNAPTYSAIYYLLDAYELKSPQTNSIVSKIKGNSGSQVKGSNKTAATIKLKNFNIKKRNYARFK